MRGPLPAGRVHTRSGVCRAERTDCLGNQLSARLVLPGHKTKKPDVTADTCAVLYKALSISFSHQNNPVERNTVILSLQIRKPRLKEYKRCALIAR